MTISEYKLKQDFRAPAVNLNPGDRMSYKMFTSGSTVRGYIHENTDPSVPLTDIPIIIANDSHAIPLNLITKIRDVEIDGKPVNIPAPGNDTPAAPVPDDKKSKIPSRYQEELDKIKNKYVVANVVKKSRNSVNGMIIGALAGLVISVAFKKPAFMSMLIGGVAGGVIGNRFTKNISAADIKSKKPAPEVAASKA